MVLTQIPVAWHLWIKCVQSLWSGLFQSSTSQWSWHSSISSQEFRIYWRKPTRQTHSNDPGVLAHAWLQSWVLVAHSSISIQSAFIGIHLFFAHPSVRSNFPSRKFWIPDSKFDMPRFIIFLWSCEFVAFLTSTFIAAICINASWIGATPFI